jgi:hypothetical protein
MRVQMLVLAAAGRVAHSDVSCRGMYEGEQRIPQRHTGCRWQMSPLGCPSWKRPILFLRDCGKDSAASQFVFRDWLRGSAPAPQLPNDCGWYCGPSKKVGVPRRVEAGRLSRANWRSGGVRQQSPFLTSPVCNLSADNNRHSYEVRDRDVLSPCDL